MSQAFNPMTTLQPSAENRTCAWRQVTVDWKFYWHLAHINKTNKNKNKKQKKKKMKRKWPLFFYPIHKTIRFVSDTKTFSHQLTWSNNVRDTLNYTPKSTTCFCSDLCTIRYFQGHGKHDVTQISIYDFSKFWKG